MDLDRLNIFLLVMLIVSTLANAESTNNLLPQQFFNNNSNHNAWTCNDPSHNHGNSIVAAHHGDSIERDVSLSEHLTEEQIQFGWSSTLGADIWHWNNLSSETDMIQTITASDGTVTTQKRTVAFSAITPYQTYTSTYIEGMNSNTDYNINVKFDFRESSESLSHQAVDLKNPTLVVDYEPNPIFLNTAQEQDIATAVEFVEEVADIEIIEFEPQEYSFELYETQEIMLAPIEEIYLEPLAVEEINTGVVEIFNLTPLEEFSEMVELPRIETFDELPEIEMEITTYDNQENFSEVATEIQIEESFVAQTEVEFSTTERVTENITEELFAEARTEPTQEFISEPETETTIREESPIEVADSGNDDTNIITEESTVREEPREESIVESTNETNESPTTVADEPTEETELRETETTESESSNETRTASEESSTSNNESEPQVSESSVVDDNSTTVTESRNDTIAEISVEKIATKVAEVVKTIDRQLVVTNLIVAKAMKSNIDIDSYSAINNNLFNNQINIDGGSYDEQREYVDNRNIYQQSEVIYNDDFSKYQRKVDDAKANTIRALEHLRRIRGY